MRLSLRGVEEPAPAPAGAEELGVSSRSTSIGAAMVS